jgi:WD40 repeat protein
MKKLPIGLLVIVTSVVYAQQPRPRSKRPIPTIAVTSPEGIPYITLLSDDDRRVQLREDLALLSESMTAQRERWQAGNRQAPFAGDNLEVFVSALEDVRNFYATKDGFLAANEEQRQRILNGSPDARVVILPDARATFTSLEPLARSLEQKFDLNESIAILQIGDYFLVPELQHALPSVIARKLVQPAALDRFARQDASFLDELNILNSLPQASQIARNLYTNNLGTLKRTIIIQHRGRISDANFSPDGTTVITAAADGTAKISNATTGAIIATIPHQAWVHAAAFSPDGTKVVTASRDGTAKISNATTGALITTIRLENPFSHWIIDAKFSPDGTKVVTASNSGSAKISNATTGALIATIQHGSEVSTAAFSPDGTKVLTASWDRTAKISDATTGALIATIRHEFNVYNAKFSPDGTKVGTASADCTAKISDATTGELIATIPHGGLVSVVAFSPDSTKVVTASGDGIAKISNATTGALIATIRHEGVGLGGSRNQVIRKVAFSPDGTKVVTTSDDGTAKISDATTGALIDTIQYEQPVYQAAFSPDSTKLVTAADNIAKITSFLPETNRLKLPQMLFVILLHHQAQTHGRITLENQLATIWDGFTPKQRTFLRKAYPAVLGLPVAVADLTKKEKSNLKITQRKQKKNIVAKAKIPTSISA